MDWDKENQSNPKTPTQYLVSNLSESVKKNYVPTPKLSDRKRALFPKTSLNIATPTIEEEKSDSSDDSFLDGLEVFDTKCPPKTSLLKTSSFLTNFETDNSTFLLLSDSEDCKGFNGDPDDSTRVYSPYVESPDIPESVSKKNTPKTPYETSNTDLELPRINNRKSLNSIFKNCVVDNYVSLKRKYESPIMEPVAKQMKLEKPKVRTSLFSNEDESVKKDDGLSPKLFYRPSLSPVKKSSNSFFNSPVEARNSPNNEKVKNLKNKRSVFLCSRVKGNKFKRRSLGDINAGVRTGIKKPKRKAKLNRSLSNHELFKAEALKFLKEKAIVNVKIEKENILPSDQVIEMDKLFEEIKNNTRPVCIENQHGQHLKRPKSPDEEEIKNEMKRQKIDDNSVKLFNATFPLATRNENPTPNARPRKFFKSKQPTTENMTINILDNLNLKVENGRAKIQSKPFRRLVKPVEFEPDEDFNDIHNKVENVLKSLEQTENLTLPSVKNEPEKDKEIENVNNPNCLQDIVLKEIVHISAHFNEINGNSILLHEAPTEIEIDVLTPPCTQLEPTKIETIQQTSSQHSTPELPSEIEMKEPIPPCTEPNILTKNLISKLNDDMIMSPTSLMCNMTSGLVLTSPKKLLTKAINLTDKLSTCPSKESSGKAAKLFPVFTKNDASVKKLEPKRQVVRSKFANTHLADDQYQLDAGQKNWGLTQCPQCDFVYSQNEPEDEQQHYEFHNKIQYLRFQGWKRERIVGYFEDNQARVLEVGPNDSKAWWKKVMDVIYVVNMELGYCTTGPINTGHSKVYLYVKNKQVIGFLLAESSISTGYRMVPDPTLDICDVIGKPIKCGVSRIWVSEQHRRKNIATHLLDILRKNFISGYVLALDDFAFSAPSADGKKLAQTYSKSKEYLIYT